MKKMKRFLSLVLTLAMAFSICVFPAQAADVTEHIEEAVEPRAVVETWDIPADVCQEMYNEMGEYNGWSDSLAKALATIAAAASGTGPMGGSVGGIVWLAAMFRELNFNATKRALKNGAESGKGCTMFIYDNAAPTILVNN